MGAAIGAGAGFVLGVVAGAVLYSRQERRLRGAGGKERRANVTVVPLHDGRLGVGASVAF